ncbi:hypothetical protein HYN24_11725 [Dechloromonas sp. HYN0024]|nr:hypothetical protein HYN24_11725 [Dechloromonas sp. HYN0024]
MANVVVSVQVIKCPMLSAFQKAAQCSIVWLAPIIGAVGIWAFLRSQYNWNKFDTRAYPEHSEKMVLLELDKSEHVGSNHSGAPHGD